jgi:hypothetical protein
MGASNALAAYTAWAGKVPPMSMQLLTYMALVSKDIDAQPWFGMGHAALAEHALGRPAPIKTADIRAVERAMKPLLEAGAVATDRRAAVRADGANTARYRLRLSPADAPRNPVDVKTKEDPPQDRARPTESVTDAPRNPSSRPTESVTTPHGIRVTEEPGGDTRSEKTEEEDLSVRTAVTVSREPVTASKDQDSIDELPASGTASPAAPERCPTHPVMRGGDRDDGLPNCPLCRKDARGRGIPVWLQEPPTPQRPASPALAPAVNGATPASSRRRTALTLIRGGG